MGVPRDPSRSGPAGSGPAGSGPAGENADPPDAAPDPGAQALARARSVARARGARPGRAGSLGRSGGPGTAGGSAGLIPRGNSGAGPDARDPQTLASNLGRLVGERGWDERVAVGGVLGRWEQVVGPDVAAHCVPVAFVDGVLVVAADSTAWATQVRLLSSAVLRRLVEEVGEGVVTTLRVQGPASPSWRAGSISARDGRGPRDTYG